MMWHRVAASLALAVVAAAGHALGAESEGPARSHMVAEAIAHEDGEDVPKDELRAAALYCEAARDGEAEAQFGLGWMYANGRGVPRNDAVAAALFALAAAAGHSGAQQARSYVRDEHPSLPDCLRAPKPQAEPARAA